MSGGITKAREYRGRGCSDSGMLLDAVGVVCRCTIENLEMLASKTLLHDFAANPDAWTERMETLGQLFLREFGDHMGQYLEDTELEREELNSHDDVDLEGEGCVYEW